MNDIEFIFEIETEAGSFEVPMYFSALEELNLARFRCVCCPGSCQWLCWLVAQFRCAF